MALTATHGRGVPSRRTSVVYLGVDAEKYRPDARSQGYLLKEFGIPPERKVLVFSGHMEERKGVRVLMAAAQELVDVRGRRDVHFLLLGNRAGEEQPFLDLISGSLALEHVTFGGYRGDVPLILPNCHFGAIASTGWDSFTVSALEMASSGLPLLVSELQGLVETVDPGTTGFTFPPGDNQSLANLTEGLLDDEEARSRMSAAARRRVLDRFTTEKQVQELVSVCRSVYGNPGAT
jgi:glycosyltransferase involved in cell wall biosynthesis